MTHKERASRTKEAKQTQKKKVLLHKAPCKITSIKASYYSASQANGVVPKKANKNNNPDTVSPISFQWFLDEMDKPEKEQPKKPTS